MIKTHTCYLTTIYTASIKATNDDAQKKRTWPTLSFMTVLFYAQQSNNSLSGKKAIPLQA
jgi:hypothetical protein